MSIIKLLLILIILLPTVTALDVNIDEKILEVSGEFNSIIKIYSELSEELIDVIDFSDECNRDVCKGKYYYDLNVLLLPLDESYYFYVYDMNLKETKRFNFGFRQDTAVLGQALYKKCELNEDCASGNCAGPDFICCPTDKECSDAINNECYDVGEPLGKDYICSDIGKFERCIYHCKQKIGDIAECHAYREGRVWEKPCAEDEICAYGGCIKIKEDCVDSDGGKNYHEKGQVKHPMLHEDKGWDFCTDSSSNSEGVYSGKYLYEQFCNVAGYPQLKFYECELSCEDGACIMGKEEFANLKTKDKYSDKKVFLISDKNWTDVLQLVPLTTWTTDKVDCSLTENQDKDWCWCNRLPEDYINVEDKGVCAYPTLVFHEEENSFDADSIIYFMQQYDVEKVTIIGDTPQELDNLLITAPELGAGLDVENIQRINIGYYLSYRQSFKDVVYVEDNYELALLASTYASLINAPLIIQGTELDFGTDFNDKNIICVGDVKRDCNEKYSLEKLQERYVKLTNTNKIILVNPNDLNIKVEQRFGPEKAGGTIKELYSKTSLAAPILASAKHEIIIPIKINTVEDIDNILEKRVNKFGIEKGFLTVLGTPDAIKSLFEYVFQSEHQEGGFTITGYADILKYSVVNEKEDKIFDLAPGRIFGISISDVSSYINRAIFYDILQKSNSVVTLAGDFSESIAFATAYQEIFKSLGYDSSKIINYETYAPHASSEDYSNKFFIYYDDHAGQTWLGLSSHELPYLKSTFILGQGCSSCIYSSYKHPNLMCAQALRKGAIGYWGMVEGGGSPNRQGMVASLFTQKTLGESYLSMSSNLLINYALQEEIYWKFSQEKFGLIGDPTLSINPPITFPLSYITKREEDNYEVNLKVANIFTEFSHSARINGKKWRVNVSTFTPMFSASSKENNMQIFYYKNYWSFLTSEEIIPIDDNFFSLAIRLGPVPMNKRYSEIIVSGNFYGHASIRQGEWINGQRYLWVVFNNEDMYDLPFEIPDTKSLFETIRFQIKLK